MPRTRSSPHPDPTPTLLAFATTAVDTHRVLGLPTGLTPAPRAELDALHTHLVALHQLLDTHTMRTARTVDAEADQLRSARTRLWQAAEHLHAAYHAAPHPVTGRIPTCEDCRARLPEGAPELTVCQRHLAASTRVRRQTTPAELHTPSTGRHHP